MSTRNLTPGQGLMKKTTKKPVATSKGSKGNSGVASSNPDLFVDGPKDTETPSSSSKATKPPKKVNARKGGKKAPTEPKPKKKIGRPKLNPGEQKFKCEEKPDTCFETFSDREKYINHLIKVHGKPKLICYYECGKIFVSNSVRRRHQRDYCKVAKSNNNMDAEKVFLRAPTNGPAVILDFKRLYDVAEPLIYPLNAMKLQQALFNTYATRDQVFGLQEKFMRAAKSEEAAMVIFNDEMKRMKDLPMRAEAEIKKTKKGKKEDDEETEDDGGETSDFEEEPEDRRRKALPRGRGTKRRTPASASQSQNPSPKRTMTNTEDSQPPSDGFHDDLSSNVPETGTLPETNTLPEGCTKKVMPPIPVVVDQVEENIENENPTNRPVPVATIPLQTKSPPAGYQPPATMPPLISFPSTLPLLGSPAPFPNATLNVSDAAVIKRMGSQHKLNLFALVEQSQNNPLDPIMQTFIRSNEGKSSGTLSTAETPNATGTGPETQVPLTEDNEDGSEKDETLSDSDDHNLRDDGVTDPIPEQPDYTEKVTETPKDFQSQETPVSSESTDAASALNNEGEDEGTITEEVDESDITTVVEDGSGDDEICDEEKTPTLKQKRSDIQLQEKSDSAISPDPIVPPKSSKNLKGTSTPKSTSPKGTKGISLNSPQKQKSPPQSQPMRVTRSQSVDVSQKKKVSQEPDTPKPAAPEKPKAPPAKKPPQKPKSPPPTDKKSEQRPMNLRSSGKKPVDHL